MGAEHGIQGQLFKPEVFGGIDPAAYIDEGYRATLEQTSIRPGLDPLEQRMRQMFALNFNWFMQTLLDRKDRMSMYSGLEVRVPFCDYRIAEYLYSVPWEYKDYEGHEKGLLRQAMQGVLPTEVLWRKKSPYPKTWNPAYLNAVSAMLRSAMQDPDAPLLRIAKRAALEQLLTAAETSTPWYGQLMTTPQTIAWFVQLNYWLQNTGWSWCKYPCGGPGIKRITPKTDECPSCTRITAGRALFVCKA